jgi:protein ImuB
MFVMNRLLDELCTRLRMHVLATNEIQLTLTLQGNGSRRKESLVHVRTLRLPVPARESKFLLKLLQLDLQNHPPNAPVIRVRISALPARPRTRQLGLFLPQSPEPELLEVTLARIRNTVGDDRVGSPLLLDTHRPDAFRWSETAWARDEWDVLMEALRPSYRPDASEPLEKETALYRIYRDLRLRRWFIEGMYD